MSPVPVPTTRSKKIRVRPRCAMRGEKSNTDAHATVDEEALTGNHIGIVRCQK